MKKIIFVADDFGLTEGVNKGILKAFKDGVIQNTALLANAPGFGHAVQLYKENTEIEISCHLTASFGKSLTKNKTLTDENGFFIKGSGFNKDIKPDEEELFVEFDAQYKKLVENGVQINGINCHHNMQMYPGVKNAFLRIARKYNQPVRNVDLKLTASELGDIVSIEGNQTFYKDKSTIEELEHIFSSMSNNTILDVQTHPGYFDDELANITSYSKERILELNLLCSKEVKSLLESHNIVLTNYKKQ